MRIIFLSTVASCCFFMTMVSALMPCINKEYCNCEMLMKNISCACANSNGSAINIQGYNVLQPIALLSVVDCEELTLGSNIYHAVKAEVTLLRDIRRLTLSSSTFHSINKGVKQLRFENTRIETLLEKTFHQLENVDSIEFVNVTVENIQSYAFCDLANIRSIVFVDSHIDSISSQAFHNVSQLEKLFFINCTIGQLQSKAINIENTTSVGLLNVNVDIMMERAIQLNDVSNFEMNDCRVNEMDKEAVKVVKAENGNVSFSRNTVRHLRDGAWRGIAPAHRVTLVDNWFQLLEEDSVDILFQLEHLTMVNNSFDCQQHLCPLLKVEVSSSGGWQMPALEGNRCNNESVSLLQFYNDDCPTEHVTMSPEERQRSFNEEIQVTSEDSDVPTEEEEGEHETKDSQRSAVDHHSTPAISTGSDVYTCSRFIAIVLTILTFLCN